MSRRPRSPACLEFTGQATATSACRSASVQAVTADAAEYVAVWTATDNARRPPALAPVLLAAGLGHARVPTCEHILRRVHTHVRHSHEKAHGAAPLLRRALSVFGPGELRALHVADPGSLKLILSVLNGAGAGARHRLALCRALDSLRAITCEVFWASDAATALIDRYAATIKQLDCVTDWEYGVTDRALARCCHLEFLARAWIFNPRAWLGLSQLHTLCGVSFAHVRIAAITAALPRLRTLHARNDREGHCFAVAGFYGDLLPRLQSFHFYGWWPVDDERDVSPPPPLPQLQEMDWKRVWQSTTLPHGFMGAQPVSLYADLPAIAEWLTTVEVTRPGSAVHGLLARVRDLRIAGAPDLTRLLRAAPQLRRLTLILDRDEEDPLWLTAADPVVDLAFAGLVHRWLRHLIVVHNGPRPGEMAADCAVILKQRHFPRLRRLTINRHEYPVSVTE